MSKEITLPIQFQTWQSEVGQLSPQQAEFEKWLFIHLASVLLSDKAGELLTLTQGQFGLPLAERLTRLATLVQSWGCRAQSLHRTERSEKVIVYRPQRVRQALEEAKCVLHKRLDYSCTTEPTRFLGELSQRWQTSGEIPHEVGLALGYPLKDVLGFMGLEPLPCTGMCGWRIYGDPQPSHHRSQSYRQAHQRASVLMALL